MPLHRKELHIADNLEAYADPGRTVEMVTPDRQCDSNRIDLMDRNLAGYYRYTNRAARAIYENDFDAASSYYDSAFVLIKYPFYADLKNYILVNHKSHLQDKNDMAIHHFIASKKIDTTHLFADIPKRVFSDNNLALVSRLVRERNITPLRANTLEEALKEMYALDQDVKGHFEIYPYIDKDAREMLDARKDKVNQDNFIQFEKLIAIHGFPDEERVGVFFKHDHRWAFAISTLLETFIRGKEEETTKKVIGIVQKALHAGELHPSIGAALLDQYDITSGVRTQEYNFLSTTLFMILGQAYRPLIFYSDSLMKQVNARRLAIGLDSFHITQNQVVCQYLGSKTVRDTTLIVMTHYARIDEMLPYGFVKMATEKANVEMSTYKINTTRILEECRCGEKVY